MQKNSYISHNFISLNVFGELDTLKQHILALLREFDTKKQHILALFRDFNTIKQHIMALINILS